MATDLSELDRFIVENDALLELEGTVGTFNIFDALGIERREIHHSYFLAWLLSPNESHGHGSLFLRAFLMDILRKADPTNRPFSPIDLDGMEFRDVRVWRELEDIDLLISCQHPRLVVVIENKIDSGEHSNQLAKYEAAAKSHFPNVPMLFVYLSPNGAEASRKNWNPYAYTDLYATFQRLKRINSKSIAGDVAVFLDHYLNLIGTRFMENPQIDSLCKRIWDNHRQALKLIFDRYGDPKARMGIEIESALNSQANNWHIFYRTNEYVGFVPKQWLEWLPPIGEDSKSERRSWLVFLFHIWDEKLFLWPEVRRVNDLNVRREIVRTLMAKASSCGFKPRTGEIKDKYTRISPKEKLLEWEEDEEPDLLEVKDVVMKRLATLTEQAQKLSEIVRPLLKKLS